MNSQIIVSRKSISKQLLVNNLELCPELKNIVKEFTFYDKVSQVSRNLKNELISRLGWGVGHLFTEGTALLAEGSRSTTVRYRHTAIQLPEFNRHNLQFISCHTCGGYIQSNTVRAHSVRCHCGVVDLIDDDEEEEEEEAMAATTESWHYQQDDEYDGSDYEYS